VLPVSFKEAMDTIAVSATELSQLLGVPAQSIRQARLDPDNPGYRPPPRGWQAVLVRLARERAPRLESLADRLERSIN
jgi:hypothetical protein